MKNLIGRLLRQPLCHFFFIAAMLFIYAQYVEEQRFNEENLIVITGDKLEQIHLKYVKLWRKQPTPEELQAKVRDYALDEAYAREARKVGFDVNDAVIKRRLKQKMRFMIQDVSDMQIPSDDVMNEYYLEHIENYRKADLYSFEFLELVHGDVSGLDDVTQVVCGGSEACYSVNDGSISVSNWDSYDVDKRFGHHFLEELSALSVDQWSAPIKATSSFYTVKLTHKKDNDYYTFDQVAEKVLDDWRIDRNLENLKTYEEKLLHDYKVVMANSDSDV